MILATHNANIPVSGGAELILTLGSDGEKGEIRNRGSVDENETKEHVQMILEGGKEAFRIRKVWLLVSNQTNKGYVSR